MRNSLIITMALSAFLALTVTGAQAAYSPLEIINIKPAGTGNPAIPATHRIFSAYPGIEYNIRVAVIGGMYPYTYALSSAPSGMTIDAATGEIAWPNPQANPGTIGLSVTDNEGTTVTTSWAITVTTNGFLFVDDSYSATQTGSIAQPFNSIANLLANTAPANIADIVYFRGGNYTFAADMNISTKPHAWIGYPGEEVNVDANDVTMTVWNNVYLDNVSIHNMLDHGVMTAGSIHYHTIRRCNFTDLTSSTSTNNNQGIIHTSKGSQGFYFVIQDNSFSNFTGGQAIGSLYSGSKTLIENNHIFDGGYAGPHSFCTPIGLKTSMKHTTIRGNIIDMPSNAATDFGVYGGTSKETDHVEICFNYIARRSNGTKFAQTHWFPFHQNCYRNTYVGGIGFRFWSSPEEYIGKDCGPYSFKSNVIINPNGGFPEYSTHEYFSFQAYAPGTAAAYYATITDENNLKGAFEEKIVDADGNLTTAYSQYLGTRGWQLAGGSSPVAIAPMHHASANADLRLIANAQPGNVDFQVSLINNGKFNLRVYDALGKQVWQANSNARGQSARIRWTAPTSGMYYTTLQQGSSRVTRKTVILD